ncbi:HEAT repeat domain-containing protein [Streptomyces libani]|uniref:HEAT repeat domain-containing protein n=1 Tax=Streptomyces nigrescens TaxID=1920 RepID=UPI0036307DC8
MDGYQGLTALIESAREELNSSDVGRRDLRLEVVSDILETGRLAQNDAERAAERLVTVALSDEGYAVRESALHAVSTASTHYELPYRVVEPLAAGVGGFEPLLLAYVLTVLGCTHDQAALPIVERFLHHPHSEVRREASEAVTELRWHRESAQDKTA